MIIVGLHWLSNERFIGIVRMSDIGIYSSYSSMQTGHNLCVGYLFAATPFILKVFFDFAEPLTAVYVNSFRIYTTAGFSTTASFQHLGCKGQRSYCVP